MHKFKPGDWVISDNEVINNLTGERYVWGGCLKKDTPYQVLECVLSSTTKMPSIILKGVTMSGSYHEKRFKLYNRFTNTKLLSGGNV